jgi:hypothetical protein
VRKDDLADAGDREVFRDVIRNGERRQSAAGDQQLLPDGHHFDELGRVAIETGRTR